MQNTETQVKLRKYEGMFLLDNREVKKGWEYAKSIPLKVMERLGCQIQSARRWDERKLAYEIKKQRRATYLLVYFEADPTIITPLNRELILTDGLLRHLVLALDVFPELAFEPVDDDVDVSKIPLGDEEPAPAVEAKPEAEKAEKAEKAEGEKAEKTEEAEKAAEEPAAEQEEKKDEVTEAQAPVEEEAKPEDKE